MYDKIMHDTGWANVNYSGRGIETFRRVVVYEGLLTDADIDANCKRMLECNDEELNYIRARSIFRRPEKHETFVVYKGWRDSSD